MEQQKSNVNKIHGYFHLTYKLNRLLNTHAFCVIFFLSLSCVLLLLLQSSTYEFFLL